MTVTRQAVAPAACNTKEIKREFIGKAWINESKVKKIPYIRISLDNVISEVKINQGSRLELWPNKKRDGKKDADYRLTISE
jgi:uncharacterized protein (DUF736 family)